jgi:hypothetical protein
MASWEGGVCREEDDSRGPDGEGNDAGDVSNVIYFFHQPFVLFYCFRFHGLSFFVRDSCFPIFGFAHNVGSAGRAERFK